MLKVRYVRTYYHCLLKSLLWRIIFVLYAFFEGHHTYIKYLPYVQILLKLTVAQDVFMIADTRLLVAGLLIAFASYITGIHRYLYSLYLLTYLIFCLFTDY